MISNDLVISCSTPDQPQFFAKGARYRVLFAVAPLSDGSPANAIARSGRYIIVPTGEEHTFALAIDQGRRILIVLVAHHPMVRPISLRHPVPQGTYRVKVYAEERQFVLKEFSFCGREFQVEVSTVSPAVVVEMVRE